ncbi:hypothetical protein AA313_de0205645 [Arthrobotrys entomopaga]|nr:hypothetical protein AA313_de0205645 [Arthrobotrys entomopaga]
MCFRLTTSQKLIPLAITLLLQQQYCTLAAAQDSEQLYYLQLHPLDITSLGARYSEDLLGQFYGDGEDVYVKEQVMDGDSVGLIDIGNPFTKQSNYKLFEETEGSETDIGVVIAESYQGAAGFPVESSEEEEGIAEQEPGVEVLQHAERDFYKIRKNWKKGSGEKRFTVEFDESGHVLGQWPFSGLPYSWVAGDEEWRRDMRLDEPV